MKDYIKYSFFILLFIHCFIYNSSIKKDNNKEKVTVLLFFFIEFGIQHCIPSI